MDINLLELLLCWEFSWEARQNFITTTYSKYISTLPSQCRFTLYLGSLLLLRNQPCLEPEYLRNDGIALHPDCNTLPPRQVCIVGSLHLESLFPLVIHLTDYKNNAMTVIQQHFIRNGTIQSSPHMRATLQSSKSTSLALINASRCWILAVAQATSLKFWWIKLGNTKER